MTVVELRPLSLGELLDRIFTLYRQHVGLFAGIMALPALAGLGIVLVSPESQNPLAAFGGQPGAPPGIGAVLSILAFSVGYWLLYSLALGATTNAVFDLQLGGSASIRGSYKRLGGKATRLVLLMVVMFLALMAVLFAGLMAAIVPALLGPLFGATWGIAVVVIGSLVGLLLFVAAIVLGFWVWAGLGVAVPALTIEDLSVGAAMRRSWELTRGRRGRIILIYVLAMIIMYVGAVIFQGPFWISILLVGQSSPASLTLSYLGGLSGLVGQTLTGPLAVIGLVLVYFDLRVRKEGFDLKLMMESLQPGAAPPAAS